MAAEWAWRAEAYEKTALSRITMTCRYARPTSTRSPGAAVHMSRSIAGVVRAALRRTRVQVVPYPEFGAELLGLLNRLEVDCVLDIGAFTGTYGRMLRDLGYRGRIVSFEPASENFNLLVREADGDGAWETRRIAVGSAAGTLELHLTGMPGSNSLLAPNAYALGEMPRFFRRRGSEEVEVTIVDDVFEESTDGAASVFLKVDTQGFDLEVIRGAASSLERLAAVQVELAFQRTYEGQPSYLELLAALDERGFAPALLFPTFSDSKGRIVEGDCVLIR
jgi:FkbM family methyltransferase